MKITIFLLCLLLSTAFFSLTLYSQNTTLPKNHNDSSGIFREIKNQGNTQNATPPQNHHDSTKASSQLSNSNKNDNNGWWDKPVSRGSALLSALLPALISAFVLIYFGDRAYKQWKHDQGWKEQDSKWRRKEAVFKRIDTLTATPGTWNAFLMLISSDREIPLWDKSKAEEKYVRINREEVALALLPPTILEYVKSNKESAIRDCFYDFFNRFSHAAALLDDKDLVEINDMRTFMEPLIHLLKSLKESTKCEDQKLLRHFYLFINYRELHAVKRLFEQFEIYMPNEKEMKKEFEIAKAEADKKVWIRKEDQDSHIT